MAESISFETRIHTRAVIRNEMGKIALCRQMLIPPFLLGLPGRRLQPGEHPDVATLDEVRKRTGLQFDLPNLHMFRDTARYNALHPTVVLLEYVGQAADATKDPNFKGSDLEWQSPEYCQFMLPDRDDMIAISAALHTEMPEVERQ